MTETPFMGAAFARTEFNYLTWEAMAAKAAREALDRQDYLTAVREAANAARHRAALTALREYAVEAQAP